MGTSNVDDKIKRSVDLVLHSFFCLCSRMVEYTYPI